MSKRQMNVILFFFLYRSDREKTMNKMRTVILAEGSFADFGTSKTAYCILRFDPESVVAVIDSEHAGKDAAQISGLGRGIPIVPDLATALQYNPQRLVIGIATVGGWFPSEWRKDIVRALELGMEVFNGLHQMFSEDAEFNEAAARGGGRIVDLRKEPENLVVASLRAQQVSAAVVLTVGTDCNTGKMTTAYELVREAESRGIKARFAATGQTGMVLAGRGICVDHVLSDFTAGAAERLVLDEAADSSVKLVVVEGQGGLAQPVYSGVTLSLMHGSLPDAMILCHRADQTEIELVETPMPSLADHIKLYEESMRLVKPARIKALSISTRGLDENTARELIDQAREQTGLPATDPVRFGAGVLLDALLENGLEKVPLYAGAVH